MDLSKYSKVYTKEVSDPSSDIVPYKVYDVTDLEIDSHYGVAGIVMGRIAFLEQESGTYSCQFLPCGPGEYVCIHNGYVVSHYGEGLSYVDDKQEEKQMKKSDIKAGMRVKIGAMMHAVVGSEGNPLTFCDKRGWMPFEDYEEDLSKYGSANWSISKVYGPPQRHKLLDPEAHGKLLWEREPPAKEMTVEAISKELGYDIKIIK